MESSRLHDRATREPGRWKPVPLNAFELTPELLTDDHFLYDM